MNIITKLSLRQKTMLALTLLAAAFLAWQIYNFVHGNAPSQPLPATPVPVVSPKAPATPMNSAVAPAIRQLPAVDSTNMALSPRQREYLTLVREYQITKMKRQILDEQANLANAQKRIADAGRNGMALNMDIDGYAGNSANGYQLAYLDRQAGQWTATINIGDQYKEVRVGSRLTDGSKVVSITNKGVVLRPAKGKNIVLGFQGSINIDNSNSSRSVKKTKPAAETAPAAKAAVATPANPNNAKIAKMLGITTTVPPKNAAPTAPASNDIPAAPLATPEATAPAIPAQPQPSNADNTAAAVPAPTEAAAPAAPQLDESQNQQPTEPQPQLQSQSPAAQPVEPAQSLPAQPPAAATVKPVSVKELREHSADTTEQIPAPVAQISWQQAADLQAAASSVNDN